MPRLLILTILLLVFLLPLAAGELPRLQDGDIIFHTSRSSQSLAVQQATGSKFSHMGLILHSNGEPFVFEAVETVRFTPLSRWIARGSNGRYVVKRLRNAEEVFGTDGRKKLRHQADRLKGRPYDLTFEWSDARIYCSELVWKIYERAVGIRLGRLQPLRSFRLDSPAVKGKLDERYGENVPLSEPVISPAAILESPLLITVVEQP